MTIVQPSTDSGSKGKMWKRCEQTFEIWLKSQGYGVNPITNAVGNTVGTNAPMLSHGTRLYRAPDFDSVKGAVREYGEVKYRSRPFTDPATGDRVFLVKFEAFRDYLEIERVTQCPVWIVVYWHGDGGRRVVD